MVILVLQDMVVPFVVFQQYTQPFVDLDEKYDNQTYVFPFENNLVVSSEKIEYVKQEVTTKIEGYFCLLFYQDAILHGIEDPFTSMLQSLEKRDFVQFMECGYEFYLYVELSDPKFLFLFGEDRCEPQSRSHLLDWLHWIYVIT